MKHQKRIPGRAGMLIILLCGLQASAGPSVVYDLAGFSEQSGAPNPSFTDNANLYLSATPLSTEGLAVPNFSDLGGTGHYVFTSWPLAEPVSADEPAIEFSVTALAPLSPTTLSYTFFSGNWSDVWTGTPFLDVWASTDDFVSATLLAQHSLLQSKPWQNSPNTFTDDLSALGPLAIGDTLSLRFVGWYPNPFERPNYAPSGFMDMYPDNFSPTLSFEAIPEPSQMLFATGLALTLAALIRRWNQS